MRLYSFIFLLFFSSPLMSQAQEKFSMEKYLRTAMQDQSLELFHAQLNFLETNNYNLPWLNRVELRIGSEDANASANDFRLRISPSNPYELKANKVYYDRQIKNINAKYEVALNQALKNRYQLIVEHYFLSNILSSFQNEIDVSRELLNSINASTTETMDLNDLVNIQSQQTKKRLSLETIKYQMAQTEYFISLDYPDFQKVEWEPQALMNVAQIQKIINDIEKANENQNLYLTESENDLALAQQELRIKKAESHSNFAYIQGNFDSNRKKNEILRDQVGFQVGIRIPIVNPDKGDLNRDKVELIEDEMKYDATKLMLERKDGLQQLQLNHLFERYAIAIEQFELSKKLSTALNKSADVMQLLKFLEYQSELNREILSVRQEVYEEFIDYLDLKGMLVSRPMINYLSPNLTPIEN